MQNLLELEWLPQIRGIKKKHLTEVKIPQIWGKIIWGRIICISYSHQPIPHPSVFWFSAPHAPHAPHAPQFCSSSSLTIPQFSGFLHLTIPHHPSSLSFLFSGLQVSQFALLMVEEGAVAHLPQPCCDFSSVYIVGHHVYDLSLQESLLVLDWP